MPLELKLLAWSAVLGLVQVLLGGFAATLQHGVAYNLSPRDEQKPVSGIAARLGRALRNYGETFPVFAAAVLVAAAAGKLGPQTAWGAQLYFWARVLYVPLYAFGVPVLRSAVWSVSLVGIVLVLVAVV